MKHIIKNFNAEPGKHCISNSMKQVMHFAGIDISEEMIFGLSSSLNFFYFEYKDQPCPMIGGRSKVGEMEKNLAETLNFGLWVRESTSIKKAFSGLKKMIEDNRPAMLYTDMAYLDYLKLPDGYHFGGHSVVVFGIDEDEGVAYVSDRDAKDHPVTLNPDESPADFHKVPLKLLAKARSSKHKPFPPKNKWIEFDFTNIQPIDQVQIYDAIRENARIMLNGPIRNLSIRGIGHFSEKLKAWKKYDDEKLRYSAFNAFIMINEKGGTGGGCFRKMYSGFLTEAGELIDDSFLSEAGEEYMKIAEMWDKVGNRLRSLWDNPDRKVLDELSPVLAMIKIKEEELMRRLSEHIDYVEY